MTATNHVITGAVIATVVTTPVVAIPLAFGAHFALDALPHMGKAGEISDAGSKKFAYYLALDASLAASILLSLFLLGVPGWPLLIACGIACASPDLMWMPKFIRAQLGHKSKESDNPILRFHTWVQWCERKWGWIVEIFWFVVMLFVLSQRLI